jgi:hypothetical protein
VVERLLYSWPVVVVSNNSEVSVEGLHEFGSERDVVLRENASVEEIQYGEQENRFVWAFVGALLVAPKVIEALKPVLPCLGGRHGRVVCRTVNKASLAVKATQRQLFCGGEEDFSAVVGEEVFLVGVEGERTRRIIGIEAHALEGSGVGYWGD